MGTSMSSSSNQLEAAAETAFRAAEAALADDATGEISDVAVQQLLTAGARLFARKMELEERYFPPFTSPDATTATEVATTVSEMLRAADLNTFDLSMWFNRPRPDDAP